VLWTSTGGQGSVDDHRLAIVHIVRVWLRTALQARDLSAEVWAHRAGVAPKVLTDCLAQDSYVPNMRVLTKLAEAADLPLPDLEQPTPLRLIKGDRADA
jgi:ribosome-binding protein aMBF1 (putative translation factor)